MESILTRRVTKLERAVLRRPTTAALFVTRAQERSRRTGVSFEETVQRLSAELSDDELDRIIQEMERMQCLRRGDGW